MHDLSRHRGSAIIAFVEDTEHSHTFQPNDDAMNKNKNK